MYLPKGRQNILGHNGFKFCRRAGAKVGYSLFMPETHTVLRMRAELMEKDPNADKPKRGENSGFIN